MSGLERGGQIRLITLTTDPDFDRPIHRDFTVLVKRLKRRGLLEDYIQVTEFTKKGYPHKHLLFRGSYIDLLFLESLWAEIHGAPIIDIRALKKLKGKKAIASELAKYMAKPGAGRYSWSWGWAWRGFAKDWTYLKQVRNELIRRGHKVTWSYFLYFWRKLLKSGKPPKRGFQVLLDREDLAVLLALLGIRKKGGEYATLS